MNTQDQPESGSAAPRPHIHWYAERFPAPTYRSLQVDVRRIALILLSAVLCGLLVVAFAIVHPGAGNDAASAYPANGPGSPSTYETGGIPQIGPDSPSSAPSETPADGASQATALQSLLQQGAPDRKTVVAAVQDIQSCGAGAGLDADISALDQAATNRSNLADQANQAEVGAIDNGTEAVQALTTAFQQSATADRAFSAWATDLKNGKCTAGSTTRNQHYKDAESASGEAGKAKDDFVTLWNSIAGRYGLQPVSADDF